MDTPQNKLSSHRSEVTGDGRKGAKRAYNRATRRASSHELRSFVHVASDLRFDSDALDALTGFAPDWMS